MQCSFVYKQKLALVARILSFLVNTTVCIALVYLIYGMYTMFVVFLPLPLVEAKSKV